MGFLLEGREPKGGNFVKQNLARNWRALGRTRQVSGGLKRAEKGRKQGG